MKKLMLAVAMVVAMCGSSFAFDGSIDSELKMYGESGYRYLETNAEVGHRLGIYRPFAAYQSIADNGFDSKKQFGFQSNEFKLGLELLPVKSVSVQAGVGYLNTTYNADDRFLFTKVRYSFGK